jgi:hypothetical protein
LFLQRREIAITETTLPFPKGLRRDAVVAGSLRGILPEALVPDHPLKSDHGRLGEFDALGGIAQTHMALKKRDIFGALDRKPARPPGRTPGEINRGSSHTEDDLDG